jgi:hypothetical protein
MTNIKFNGRNGRNTTFLPNKTVSTNLQSKPLNKIKLKVSLKSDFNDIEELKII